MSKGLCWGVGIHDYSMGLGLWKGLRWTEWLALIGCVIHVPFEVYGLIHHPGIIGAVILIVNLLIIAYIARTLQAKPELVIQS
ncbi:DUF2127 domain-containing protein [Vibrio sp. Isolate25]|uniref:DUF2127 domain-containing protein n=1 Tax=Vibrio sp. Isolate25 TaxID=2908535 RepID=UPI001EFD1519|nr:DUF2127 domain-containing protein [Vibrio sp. Isolate25]MCG9597530.1 DUF2127 domain-containing protein [Vibrio sp. Isolate25]